MTRNNPATTTDEQTEQKKGRTEQGNPPHALVEDAFALASEKLEQDEVTVADIRDVYDALDEACSHEESDIWVTITALGPKNQCGYHLKEGEGGVKGETPRDTLENIVGHEIGVTVQ